MDPNSSTPDPGVTGVPVNRQQARRKHAPASATSDASEAEEYAVELRDALNRLRAAEAELQRRSSLLIATRLRAQTERQRYVELFESAPDGYLVTDGAGKIVEANRATGYLFQWP